MLAGEDVEGLRLVREPVGVPIAADEAVTTVAAAQRITDCEAADVLVVKPMLVGGMTPARRIIELAERAGSGALVTTTIDGGVGIAAALHLAATLGDNPLACGLATAGMLESTLVSGLPPATDGTMIVPSAPGLGIALDHSQLQRWQHGDG